MCVYLPRRSLSQQATKDLSKERVTVEGSQSPDIWALGWELWVTSHLFRDITCSCRDLLRLHTQRIQLLQRNPRQDLVLRQVIVSFQLLQDLHNVWWRVFSSAKT